MKFFYIFCLLEFWKKFPFWPILIPSTYRPRLSNLEAVRLFWIAFLNENIKMKDFTQGRFKQICWPLYSPPNKDMRISPLHRTRKTVDFGHIIFKNQSRLHEDKLKKTRMTDNCKFPLIYYITMVICAWLSLINGTQVRHADFAIE